MLPRQKTLSQKPEDNKLCGSVTLLFVSNRIYEKKPSLRGANKHQPWQQLPSTWLQPYSPR